MSEFTITEFKGMKNDIGSKHVPINYFYNVINCDYDDIIGANKILAPVFSADTSTGFFIDGMIQYKFLTSDNYIKIVNIGISNGNIYKDIIDNPTIIYSGLSIGKCSFTVLNDKLFITNGKDYPLIYWGDKDIFYEMGAPAVEDGASGHLTGTYYYAMTYVTAGGEEVLGTISNSITISNRSILVNLPIGYYGTTSRKLYRIENGGSVLKLVDTISDNTTLTYLDDVADIDLTDEIPDINNEMVKPHIIKSLYEKLIGGVVDLFPTQTFVGETEIELFEPALGFIDVSNQGGDNSPVTGIEIDYSNLVIGTMTNIYIGDVTGDTVSLKISRANIGIKNGFTMVRIPRTGTFVGGIMFLSTENDIRIINGQTDIIPNTVVDISTDNLFQNVRATLKNDAYNSTIYDAVYFDYKYQLLLDNYRYTFDIRTQNIAKEQIVTDTYRSRPCCFGIFNNYLYNGQTNGKIERENASITYYGENFKSILETPDINVSDNYNFIKDLTVWFKGSINNNIKITVITDSNYSYPITAEFNIYADPFDSGYFSPNFFNADTNEEDFRVIHVNRQARWFKVIIENEEGRMFFRGIKITTLEEINQEGGQ